METKTIRPVVAGHETPDKIGAVVVLGAGSLPQWTYHGIQCAKGRGVILPGGKWEPDKDPTYRHTASRELYEELGLYCNPYELEYIWHGPDGYGYTTFAFWCRKYAGEPKATNEGTPVAASVADLTSSLYGPWYDVLFSLPKLRKLQRQPSVRWPNPDNLRTDNWTYADIRRLCQKQSST